MKIDQQSGTRDTTNYLAGGGCLFSIPLALYFGFRWVLAQAEKKEHSLSHQVEEVELEGHAAVQLDDGLSGKEALGRFVKKLERVTSLFDKTGARFSAPDYKREMNRFNNLKTRIASESASDPECQAMLDKAQKCLQQYAPQD